MIIEFAKYKNFSAPERKPVKNDWILDEYNNLAKIIDYDEWSIPTKYQIKYFTNQHIGGKHSCTRDTFKHFGTREEMDMILQAKKYNL